MITIRASASKQMAASISSTVSSVRFRRCRPNARIVTAGLSVMESKGTGRFIVAPTAHGKQVSLRWQTGRPRLPVTGPKCETWPQLSKEVRQRKTSRRRGLPQNENAQSPICQNLCAPHWRRRRRLRLRREKHLAEKAKELLRSCRVRFASAHPDITISTGADPFIRRRYLLIECSSFTPGISIRWS
jgi:hypothetical protein